MTTEQRLCEMFGGPLDGQRLRIADGAPEVRFPVAVGRDVSEFDERITPFEPMPMKVVTYKRVLARPDTFVFQPDL